MQLERHLPRPPLAGLVDHLWHVSDAPAHARERILPNGCVELVFNLAEDEISIYGDTSAQPCRRLSGSVVSGVFSRFFVIDTRAHSSMLGVHFKPGGAFPFLRGLPVLELENSHLDLSELWGGKAARLRERLSATENSRQRFELLEAALLEEFGGAGPRHRAIAPALHALDSVSVPIGVVAAQANLSHRRLIELFGVEVGATPKLFQRVQRFQRALALARNGAAEARLAGAIRANAGWAQLAHLAGYCDQSHWIRDCVAFSGLTPEQYSSQWTVQVKPDHMPLVTAVG